MKEDTNDYFNLAMKEDANDYLAMKPKIASNAAVGLSMARFMPTSTWVYLN